MLSEIQKFCDEKNLQFLSSDLYDATTKITLPCIRTLCPMQILVSLAAFCFRDGIEDIEDSLGLVDYKNGKLYFFCIE